MYKVLQIVIVMSDDNNINVGQDIEYLSTITKWVKFNILNWPSSKSQNCQMPKIRFYKGKFFWNAFSTFWSPRNL